MRMTLFVVASVAINLLAIVFLVRGLRAKTRSGCSERAAWCFLLAIVQGGAVVVTYIAGLATSFADVANADPSQKANLLSESISANLQVMAWGVLALLPPIIYAFMLFVRRYRFPAAPEGGNQEIS